MLEVQCAICFKSIGQLGYVGLVYSVTETMEMHSSFSDANYSLGKINANMTIVTPSKACF